MKRLHILIILCAAWLLAPAASAQTLPTALVETLASQGYTITSARYTWLGRIYIEAENAGAHRSILVTRNSGIILQDSLFARSPETSENLEDSSDSDSDDRAAPPRPNDRDTVDRQPEERPPQDNPPESNPPDTGHAQDSGPQTDARP